MLAAHRQIFTSVANGFVSHEGRVYCWIGLREPNPLADKWIYQPYCMPKVVQCKAKTADNSSSSLAGLVVNPLICKDAFSASSRESAIATWRKWAFADCLPQSFACDEDGVVRYHGYRLFSDYDLMFLCLSNRAGDYLFTEKALSLFEDVKTQLNSRFGIDMIQHGAEFTYEGDRCRQGMFHPVGAKPTERVWLFGPGNRFQVTVSSMSTILAH